MSLSVDPAPARELGWARQGAAYFARKLRDLPDDALAAASLVPGWSRAHVVAHVGYGARALARLVECARTGARMPTDEAAEARLAAIELAATLPPQALRTLFAHAEAHLNAEWRDLTDDQWTAVVAGTAIRETPWLRARDLWFHAVELGNGGSVRDLPAGLRDRLRPEPGAVSGPQRRLTQPRVT